MDPNGVSLGWYAMPTHGLLSGGMDRKGDFVEPKKFNTLAVVGYNGKSNANGNGAGRISGKGVFKGANSGATVQPLGDPEPLDPDFFTVDPDRSFYWIDAGGHTGRAHFSYIFSGDPDPHVVDYFFVIRKGGRRIEFISTTSTVETSQWGVQKRIVAPKYFTMPAVGNRGARTIMLNAEDVKDLPKLAP